MATIITPRSHASFKASVISCLCGALPAPKVSKTTPCTGGIQKALSVAPEIPGNKRRVALAESEIQSFFKYGSTHTYMGAHRLKELSNNAAQNKTIITHFDEL